MSLTVDLFPTAIGSVSQTNADSACQLVFECFQKVPVWPQLPQRSFFENMYCQFSEGMPGIVIDKEAERIYFDTTPCHFFKSTETFYSHLLNDDIEYFSISEEYALGLYRFLEKSPTAVPSPLIVKGQITGPISFGLTVNDQNKRASFYDPTLKDVIINGLGMKAKWMEQKIREAYGKIKTLIFFDEPYLVSIGSAFVSLEKDDVRESVNKVISYLDGYSGIHCCGNTDWQLLLDLNLDVVNFDAYNYIDSLLLFSHEVESFIKKGGILAFGIVPTSCEVFREDSDSLLKRFVTIVDMLEKKGIDRKILLRRSLITPSCGVGSGTNKLTNRIYRLTSELSQKLRDHFSGDF
ncbi:MAG: hypothetical protein SVW57_04635 [Thermodesulfobacteriota bacterium]|nr:hypothetical protein [Thermodesulfobacteriota bacterium]